MKKLEEICVKITADISDFEKKIGLIERKRGTLNLPDKQNPTLVPNPNILTSLGFTSGNNTPIQDEVIFKLLDSDRTLQSFEQTYLEGTKVLGQIFEIQLQDLKNQLRERLGQNDFDESEIEDKLKFLDIFSKQQIEPFLENFNNEVETAAALMTANVKSAFVEMAATGEFSAKQIGRALANIVIDLLFQQLIEKPLTNFFSSIFGVITGGKAAGGTVAADVPTFINERGQEVFIPHTPGRIVNAIDSRRLLASGSQVVVNQNLNFDAAIKNDMMATIFQASPIIVEQTRRAVLNSLKGRRI